MKPVIGINLDVESGPPHHLEIQSTYVDAIREAGGIPLLLPPMSDEDIEQVASQLWGVMLIGGRDYCPSRYGASPEACLKLGDPLREEFDFRLMRKILKETEMPILGVCLGSQLLNITCGGTLIQDIPSHRPESKVTHSSEDGWIKGFHKHLVKIKKSTFLSNFYPEELEVSTSHHQAVDKIGEGLDAVAFAEDGIVEAVEMPGRNFTLGVQWHPERDYPGSQKLFQSFINAAAKSGPGAGVKFDATSEKASESKSTSESKSEAETGCKSKSGTAAGASMRERPRKAG
jgi:putative glutamine amidotransferase